MPAAAEDVVQDVFLALWRDPAKFDAARGSLRTYVAMMARSRALDRVRTRGAREAAAQRLQAEEELRRRASGGARRGRARRDARSGALHAVRDLPAAQREAVALTLRRQVSPRGRSPRRRACRSARPRAGCGWGSSRRATARSRGLPRR